MLILLEAAIIHGDAAPSQGTGNMGDFDREVSKVVYRIDDAYRMGANVTIFIDKVNNAISLYRQGRVRQAYEELQAINKSLSEVLPMARHKYHVRLAEKYVASALILATPLIVYWGLPRLYLCLWFSTRRKWIVEETGNDNG